jgi:hypothetical protein
MHHWCLRYYETILYILSISWGVNSIPFGLNSSHVSGCVDHPFSLECLNNIVELPIELPWKMVAIALFNCEIPEWCVVANPHMVIKNFLVIEIQATPLSPHYSCYVSSVHIQSLIFGCSPKAHIKSPIYVFLVHIVFNVLCILSTWIDTSPVMFLSSLNCPQLGACSLEKM